MLRQAVRTRDPVGSVLAALAEGRTAAEKQLLKDRQGRRCAERLCFAQDAIIRVLYEFAVKRLYKSQNPSEAEHMAVIATGGYGRGLMAPGSDIDLLFLLPYKQTAWGESVAEAILYCLWDMGLKVGHATRSVDECIRQAKADMTIRTAMLEARFILGDQKLFDELVQRFDKQVGDERRVDAARNPEDRPFSTGRCELRTNERAAEVQDRICIERQFVWNVHPWRKLPAHGLILAGAVPPRVGLIDPADPSSPRTSRRGGSPRQRRASSSRSGAR